MKIKRSYQTRRKAEMRTNTSTCVPYECTCSHTCKSIYLPTKTETKRFLKECSWFAGGGGGEGCCLWYPGVQIGWSILTWQHHIRPDVLVYLLRATVFSEICVSLNPGCPGNWQLSSPCLGSLQLQQIGSKVS